MVARYERVRSVESGSWQASSTATCAASQHRRRQQPGQ